MKTGRFISMMAIVAACLAGCRCVELHVSTSSVFVNFIPDTSFSIHESYHDEIAENPDLYEKAYGPEVDLYQFCFYDLADHKLVAEDFVPAQGGFLNIPSGTYDVVIYSSGSSVTLIDGRGSRAGIHATTSAASRYGQRVISEPEHIFVAYIENFEIPLYSQSDGLKTIDIHTEKILETYSLEFTSVQGMENISDIEIQISGQTLGTYLWQTRDFNVSGAMSFKPTLDQDNGRIYGLFNTFGRDGSTNSNAEVSLIVTGRNDQKYQWKVNVTDQMDDPDNTSNRIVIDSQVNIPGSDSSGGFTPDVNDWSDDVTYVPIT